MSRMPAYKALCPTDETEVTCPAWMLDSSNRMKVMLLAISAELLVNPREVMSNSAAKDIALARQVGYWILRQTTRLSYGQIANRFRRFDHTTIQHGVAVVEKKRETCNNFRAMTNTILAKVVSGRPPVAVATPSPYQFGRKAVKSLGIGGMMF